MSVIRKAYGVKHKNEEIRAASRSGGVFTAFSDVILEKGGVIYGCALEDNINAVHKRAANKSQRDSFRGSKYIQSSIGDSYRKVEKDLICGKEVLFSGTPCQIHGLLNYLNIRKIETDKLITVDILCHGVPSPRVWRDFVLQKFSGMEIDKVDFKDKSNFGWRDHVETITADGKEFSSKEYTKLFYSHYILRESCFDCGYKNTNRISDITIGDFWRIENVDPEFDDNKGLSLVLLNTEKGKTCFEQCIGDLTVREYDLAACIQPALSYNYAKPNNREIFWQEYTGGNIMQMIEKYTAAGADLTRMQKIESLVMKFGRFALNLLKKV